MALASASTFITVTCTCSSLLSFQSPYHKCTCYSLIYHFERNLLVEKIADVIEIDSLHPPVPLSRIRCHLLIRNVSRLLHHDMYLVTPYSDEKDYGCFR